MKTGSSFFRRSAWVLGVAVGFAHQAAQACPGCKQVVTVGPGGSGSGLSGTSIGFSLGVLFMIAMVVGVLGFLGRMMYRSCQIIAAQQQAAMDRDDAQRGGMAMGSARPA